MEERYPMKRFEYQKGQKMSLEDRIAIGKLVSIARKKNKYHLTKEHKLKLSKLHKKENLSPITRERIKLAGLKRRGTHLSKEHKERLSKALTGRSGEHVKGSKNHFWKGGVTPINLKIRQSIEYKLWRTAVFERDNYTCIWCFKKGVRIQADHIKPFSLFPELRFAIDNGRTLCRKCHETTDTFGYKLRKWTP